jgi:hypothetical protein
MDAVGLFSILSSLDKLHILSNVIYHVSSLDKLHILSNVIYHVNVFLDRSVIVLIIDLWDT